MVYIGLGVSYVFADADLNQQSAVYLATRWLPFSYWGALWIAVGLMAIVSARWPPVSKTWGYSAMTGLASAWAGLYLVGICFLNAPLYQISGTLAWGLLAFMWWVISGLVAPDDPES
jgi:hypothetical protein